MKTKKKESWRTESMNWMQKYISLPVRSWDVRLPETVSVP